MRLRSACVSGVSALLLSVAVAAPAAAQEQKGDVAFSYSILHDSELEETFPTGWALAANRNLNDRFGIVGEAGGNYKTVDVLGTDFDFRVHSFMGGVRVKNQTSQAVPFAQVLVGLARLGGSVLGESDSSNEFAIQPGAGVDFHVSDRFGVRLQGDYRMITGEDSWNEFRFSVGGVLGFGR